jgi:hypothetical protein
MASGSIAVSTGNQYISGHLDWSSTPDTVNNRSTVTATMRLSRTNSGYTTTGSGSFTITINGVSYTNSASFTITQNSDTLMVTFSTTVDHNSDGSKSITISCSGDMPSTSMDGASGSGTAVLDTIARASGISVFNNFTIGSGFTVTGDVKSSVFTHVLTFKAGSSVIATRTWTAGTSSATITLTQAEYNVILNAIASGGTSTTVTLTLETKSGSTTIGTASKSVTASISASTIATFNDFTIGSDITVIASTNLPSLAFKFELKVGSTSIKSVTTAAGDNSTDMGLGTTQRDAMLNLVASGASSVTATLYVTTLYGTKQIGAVATNTSIANVTVGNITAFAGFNINGTGKPVTATGIGTAGLTYKLELKIGSTSILTRTSGLSNSYSLVLSSGEQTAMYNAMPTVISTTCTLYLTTLYGTKQIGAIDSITATAAIDTSVIKPSIGTVTAVETKTAAGQVGAVVGEFVQLLSSIKMDINTAYASSGATLKSYKIEFLGASYAQQSYTTGPINSSGTGLVVKGTVTDSRGLTATKQITIDIMAYKVPTLTLFKYSRANSAGVSDVLGTYASITNSGSISTLKNASGTETNALTYKLYSSPRGANSWTLKKTVTVAAGTLSTVNAKDLIGVGGEYLATTSYDYQIQFADKFNTTISVITMPSGEVSLSWGKKGLGIGKILEQGVLDVLGDSYFNGDIYLAPVKNFKCMPTANGQEWSFDLLNSGTFTGTYWQVWSSTKTTLLKVEADTGLVTVPYNLTVGGNINSTNSIFSTGAPATGNVDHIWHDDTANAWNFCSDVAEKTVGNSKLVAGSADLSGSLNLDGNVIFTNQSTGVNLAFLTGTPTVATSGAYITGGADYAGLTKLNNVAIQTWFGFSVSPTISGQAVPQGTPAFSVDARTGNVYAKTNFYVGATAVALSNHNHDGAYANVAGDTFTGTVNGINFSTDPTNGHGFRFWNSESYKIYMSQSADATWGGRYGEAVSDYNMYFKMSGTNRGFVFMNGTTELLDINPTGIWANGSFAAASTIATNYGTTTGQVIMGYNNELYTTFTGANPVCINYRGGATGGLKVYNGATNSGLGPIYGSTKSAVVSTENYGEVVLYCDESPNHVFHDSGHGVIGEDGLCYISLDPIFLETVSTKNGDYLVFLTGYIGSNVEIVGKYSDYFIVSGIANKEFDWLIRVERKGMERLRFNDGDIVI